MEIEAEGRGRDTREVEVKYVVDDPSGLVTALEARGVLLADAVTQDDQAYSPVGWTYGQPKIGVPFARLRTQNGHHLFTVKIPVLSELDCTEHECEVSDRAQMHRALLAMGFRATARILKTRRVGKLGTITVCLDEVDGLGTFLELESITDADAAHAQADMNAIAVSLGVAVTRVSATYDSLLREGAAVR
jgi:adenylate cyclase class 2